MTPKILLDDDEGMIAVEVAGKGEVLLDIYEVNNRLVALSKQFEGKPSFEFHGAIVKLMTELGVPATSHRAADRFALGIYEACEQLVKKKNGQPDSSASTTDSIPGP